ncbi:hypothetical protein ABZ208_13235 [Streptomyces sp. NPDC006208]|uniref:hypothetical protein n=1 Tax=Streptomyces sp. NPDC006208 TaxID=3156734 RepID=UPI0033B3BFB2
MSTNTDRSPAPFLLPVSLADRETAEGWRGWRLSRRQFASAPRIDLAAFRAMSPRQRALHELHREATHSNLPLLETPMSAAVARLMRSRLRRGAMKHKASTRPGLMIDGGGCQSKTETAFEVAAAFEDAWLDMHQQLNPDSVTGVRDLHAPVAYVQTPVTAKPKSTCKAVLDFFGADHRGLQCEKFFNSTGDGAWRWAVSLRRLGSGFIRLGLGCRLLPRRMTSTRCRLRLMSWRTRCG